MQVNNATQRSRFSFSSDTDRYDKVLALSQREGRDGAYAKGVAKEKFVACVVVVSGGWVGNKNNARAKVKTLPPTTKPNNVCNTIEMCTSDIPT